MSKLPSHARALLALGVGLLVIPTPALADDLDGDGVTDGSLVAAYLFEGSLADSGTGGYDAVGYNTAGDTYTDGACGEAIQLDGAGEFLEIPAHALSAFTVSAWVRTDWHQSWQRVWDFGGTYGAGGSWFLAANNGRLGNQLGVGLHSGDGGLWGDLGTGAYPSDAWRQVVVTYDGSGEALVYLDGTLVSSGYAPLGLDELVGARWLLGGSNWPDPTLAGSLDEVRIYDRALASGEVASLYAADDLCGRSDTDGDGVPDDEDVCDGPDDADRDTLPDCAEEDVAFAFSGALDYGYCSGPDGYEDLAGQPFSARATYPLADAAYVYSETYGDPGSGGYDYIYASFSPLRTVAYSVAGRTLSFGAEAYTYGYVQDYTYYGTEYDYVHAYGYSSVGGSYAYADVAASSGDFVDETLHPVPGASSLGGWGYFEWLEDGGATYCYAYGSLTATGTDVVSDADGDGVSDADDVCPFGDDTADADGDGTADACDACPVDRFNDSDGDGRCDSADLCALDAANDADGDGYCGDVEPGCDLDAENDGDGDGVCAPYDICVYDAQNDADGDGLCADEDPYDDCPDQVDSDGDGTANLCDVCPADFFNDSDFDGSCDSDDLCPLDPADDADGDALCADEDLCPLDGDNDIDADAVCGDVDPCPVDAENDADGDGVCEVDDNCASVSNPNQSNLDGDVYGDACEPDADDDGVIDDDDNCAFTANADQGDTDADAQGDACDADDDGDSVNDSVDTCAATPAGVPTVATTGC
ncbi:MAG: LamG-like jellyroll fold domain-containing protein, partial [Myxococcota bacterium]